MPHPAWRLTCADGFSFGRYDNDVLVHLYAVFVPEHAWQHDLRPVTDGVDLQSCIASDALPTHRRNAARKTHRAVLHHQPPVRHQQLLQREDDPPQVRLVLVVVKLPLRV